MKTLTDLERRASKHPRYRGNVYKDSRHFIITMKEETFECVCDSMELTHMPEKQHS